jgi:hypothetical protein
MCRPAPLSFVPPAGSFRDSPQTVVGIRSPPGALADLRTCQDGGYGLPRRCAPRNDPSGGRGTMDGGSGGYYLHSMGIRMAPSSPTAASRPYKYGRTFVQPCRGGYQPPAPPAQRSHRAPRHGPPKAAAPTRKNHRLSNAVGVAALGDPNPRPPQGHSETVRRLSWESVLRRGRRRTCKRVRTGVTDCHVASLLAMTRGGTRRNLEVVTT